MSVADTIAHRIRSRMHAIDCERLGMRAVIEAPVPGAAIRYLAALDVEYVALESALDAIVRNPDGPLPAIAV